MSRPRSDLYLFFILGVIGIALLLGLFFLPDRNEAEATAGSEAPISLSAPAPPA